MVHIDDLTGINERKRNDAINCLESLLSFKDEKGNLTPIISGYNFYPTLPQSKSIITFSNMHETERYKEYMLEDLEKIGYDSKILIDLIRQKRGVFFWYPNYRIRNDSGVVLNINIKDLRNGKYIQLEKYGSALIKHEEFLYSKGYLLAEGQGWELNLPFKNKEELKCLSNLFLIKAGLHIYDENGVEIQESVEEKLLRAHWPDAYETPVLIIGKSAMDYAKELPHFDIAIKIALIENNNEISFIIHKKIDFLKQMHHYPQLQELGFTEEECLCNKPFLDDIDKIRQV